MSADAVLVNGLHKLSAADECGWLAGLGHEVGRLTAGPAGFYAL